MSLRETDLLAVGGGTAGLVSAAGAAYLGASPTLVEKSALGGDCLWTGCVPSKALLASARLAHQMRHAEALGLRGTAPGPAFGEVMARMRSARDTVAHHDDPERFRSMGVEGAFGSARFVDRDVVEVEGVGRIRSKRIILATGAVPAPPPVPGLEEVGYLDHHSVFEIDSLPARVTILGGGPIGLEFSQIFRRLGAEVTVVEMSDRLLPKEDRDMAEVLGRILRGEGIDIRLGSRAEKAERRGEAVVVRTDDGGEIEGDALFVATGRRPATDGLELDRAGVRLQENGGVEVDDRLRSSNPHVWAAGDVAGGMQFTHLAEAMAKTALRNALVPGSSTMDYDHVPWVTYTDPELANIGLSQEEAEAEGGTTYRYGFDDLDRAIVEGATEGLVKIHADGGGRILGASILGAHAGELLFPLVLARRKGLTLSDIADTIFPYPTMSEGIKRAANEYQRGRLDGLGGTLLKKVISWTT